MNQKTLATWLKLIIIGVAICGIAVCAVVLPKLGWFIDRHYGGEYTFAFWPCLIFLWVCMIPCFAVLIVGWRIATNIGDDRSFCVENAKLLRLVSLLAACDSVFFFAGNILMLLFFINYIGFVMVSAIITFIGIAISIAAAVASHLVKKAADIQAENELTI